MIAGKMLPEDLLAIICAFAGDPAAAYGMHLAGLLTLEQLRHYVVLITDSIEGAHPPRLDEIWQGRRQKPEKRWRRRCGWEVQQLYERPHDSLTASLSREFGPLDEQREWQVDLLSLLCKPLEICRELLLYAVPKKVGILFRTFYEKLNPDERRDIGCYAMLYECQNYYPKLLDDYHFSFAANEGMPLYLALCRRVNMHKLLAQQIQRRPADFVLLPWKEILVLCSRVQYCSLTQDRLRELFSVARKFMGLSVSWSLRWIAEDQVSGLNMEVTALTKEALRAENVHKLVRDLYKASPSDSFVCNLICALEEIMPLRSVNMDSFIFGETATDVVNLILESSVTWISSDTLVRMLKLGWLECVRRTLKRNAYVRAWTCYRAFTRLPPTLQTAHMRHILGLGDG